MWDNICEPVPVSIHAVNTYGQFKHVVGKLEVTYELPSAHLTMYCVQWVDGECTAREWLIDHWRPITRNWSIHQLCMVLMAKPEFKRSDIPIYIYQPEE